MNPRPHTFQLAEKAVSPDGAVPLGARPAVPRRAFAAACVLAAGAYAVSPLTSLAADAGPTGTSGSASMQIIADKAEYDAPTGSMILSGNGSNSLVRILPARVGEPFQPRESSWLGAAVEEAPEVVTSQLGLEPGVGLVVSFVASNSPAAKAGLEKNDVLVEMNGEKLFHPLQLRKMIQVRKEGEEIKLTFYRGGKRQTATAKLEKTRTGFGTFQSFATTGDGSGAIKSKSFTATGDPFVAIESSRLSPRMKMDEVRRQIDESRRNIDEARRAYDQAVRSGTASQSPDQIDTLRKALEQLAKSELALDDKATVTVRSTGSAAKSLVKADESGTIVLVTNPNLRLTAHDKAGQLLFDGEIESADQRAQVPSELWKKVEPLLDKLNSSGPDKTKIQTDAGSRPTF